MPSSAPADWTLVIHGGAGRITRQTVTPEEDATIRAALTAALAAGAAVLDAGGSALDAVEAAVVVLEDAPCFNAGRGACFTHARTNELDAAIMDGRDRRAGAVAGVTATRNPIRLARAVMEDSPHVLLVGTGADAFSAEHGLEQAGPDWFATPARRMQIEAMLEGGGDAFDVDMKYGTVGAVARDRDGHVAAATSTGGVTGKRWGRVGDSPVPGAGTWADDRACAVSCTGSGEFFLRTAVAHEIGARRRFAGEDLATAAAAVLGEVTALGGTGGVIVAGAAGDSAWAFTTPGMHRGSIAAGGAALVELYGEGDR